MPELLRWGILGTGNIAGQFAAGMKTSRRGRVIAVGSRSPQTAETFSQNHGIESRHDYAGLIANPNVDAVYLSLPNSLHHHWTIQALRAGKHVLCEKPFAMSVAESQEMFDIAEKSGRVLVEAFMHRSHPLSCGGSRMKSAPALIGQVRTIRTSFCYRTNKIAGNVRFDRALGGGALMDVGCYCINFSRHFAGGEPTAIHASATFHQTGIDEITSAIMQFPDGIVATFICGMSVQADNTATIGGSEGYVEIPVRVTGNGYRVDLTHQATVSRRGRIRKTPPPHWRRPGNPCRWMSIKIYTPWRPTISRRRCWMALRRPSPAQTRSETCASSTKCVSESDFAILTSDRNHHRRGPCRLYRGHSAFARWMVGEAHRAASLPA